MSLLKRIKALFDEEDTNTEETSMEFVDVKTKDGAIMRVPDLAVEAPVVEITEDGEVAVEDGDYELEDGTVLKVVDGIIKEIMPAAEEDQDGEDVTEEMASDEVNDKVDVIINLLGGLAEGEPMNEDVKAEVLGLLEAIKSEEGEQEVAEEMEKTEKFYDVFLKNGGAAHVINTKEGEMNEGDKMVIEGKDAAPGEYELNSGETVTVGDQGVIDAIASVDESVEGLAEGTEGDEKQADDEEVQGIVNNLKNLVKQIKDLKSQFAEVKEDFIKIENENKELKESFSKFADMPSDEPTKTKKDFNVKTREDKLKFFGKK